MNEFSRMDVGMWFPWDFQEGVRSPLEFPPEARIAKGSLIGFFPLVVGCSWVIKPATVLSSAGTGHCGGHYKGKENLSWFRTDPSVQPWLKSEVDQQGMKQGPEVSIVVLFTLFTIVK